MSSKGEIEEDIQQPSYLLHHFLPTLLKEVKIDNKCYCVVDNNIYLCIFSNSTFHSRKGQSNL